MPTSFGIVFIAMIVTLIVCAYFLPTIVAVIRNKSNKLAIFVMNLFLGWTFIGWVVALIWAVAKDNTALEK